MYIQKTAGLIIFIFAFATIHCFGNGGDKNANILTDMVKNMTKNVRDIRDKSVKISSEKDIQALQGIAQEIKGLAPQLQAIKTFVEKAIAADPDFKNKLNDEGMPPRIIEGELELYFRYDLAAVGNMWAFIVTPVGAKDLPHEAVELQEFINTLVQAESKIYETLENLQGPLIRFKNLAKRYNKQAQFIAEDKRYTPQEAHVALHIAAFVISVEDALALVQFDSGRHLYFLLHTYVDWLPGGAHMFEDVEVIQAHGSIMSITDKNGKTFLDWAKELNQKVTALSKNLNKRNKPSFFIDLAIAEDGPFAQIQTILKGGLTKPEGSEEVRKMKSRSLSAEGGGKLNELGFRGPVRWMSPEEDEQVKRLQGLDLATKRDLGAVSEKASSSKFTSESKSPALKNTPKKAPSPAPQASEPSSLKSTLDSLSLNLNNLKQSLK